MALYCLTCRNVAGTGAAVCDHCKNGFVSKLACATCNKVVDSGFSYCPDCARTINVATSSIELVPPKGSLPALSLSLPPGLDPYARVPEVRRDAGRFGVTATVQIPRHDVDVLDKMNQVAAVLHALAAEMNTFTGIGESTRSCIRGCRDLATRLQEEIEIRRGPQ